MERKSLPPISLTIEPKTCSTLALVRGTIWGNVSFSPLPGPTCMYTVARPGRGAGVRVFYSCESRMAHPSLTSMAAATSTSGSIGPIWGCPLVESSLAQR